MPSDSPTTLSEQRMIEETPERKAVDSSEIEGMPVKDTDKFEHTREIGGVALILLGVSIALGIL